VALGRIGMAVAGIGVIEDGRRVKVGKNRNCVGVGSSGDNVEKLPEISVMVGCNGLDVSEAAAPAVVAVIAPGAVGVPCD